MTAVVSTFDDLADDTDLAVTWPDANRTDRYQWRGGRLHKHGVEGQGLDPFFFTGLLAQERIVLGDFAPPQEGEWFGYRNGRREHYRFFVAQIVGEKASLIYFTRGEYAGWTEVQTDRIFDDYARIAPEDWPAVTRQMFQAVALSGSQYKESSEANAARYRNMNDARQSLRYAKEYIDQALQYADRR